MANERRENNVVYLTPFQWSAETVIARLKRNLKKRKLSRRRGTPWYRHRDAWKRTLKACGWWEPSLLDPTLTDSEYDGAFLREFTSTLEVAGWPA